MVVKLYEKPSLKKWFVEKFKSFFEKNSLVRISTFNKLKDYRSLLNKVDQLFFESHPPEIEPLDILNQTLDALSKYFNIVERPEVSMNNLLTRTELILLQAKNLHGCKKSDMQNTTFMV